MSLRIAKLFIFAIVVLSFWGRQSAAQPLLFPDGKTANAKLIEIQKNRIVVEQDTARKEVAHQSFLRFGHPNLNRQLDSLVLLNGTIIACYVKSIDKNQIRFQSRVFDADSISIQSVRGVIFRETISLRKNQSIMDEILFNRPAAAKAILVNEDIAVGTLVESSQAKTLTLRRGEIDRSLDFDQIRYLSFPSRSQYSWTDTKSQSILGLQDGTKLVFSKWNVSQNAVSFEITPSWTITAPLTLRQKSFFDRVDFFQPANANMRFLSVEEPLKIVDNKEKSFLKTARNRGVDGGPLMSGGKHYEFGMGTHGPTQIIFKIEPSDKIFRATVAFGDSSNPIGNVLIRVLLLKDRWLPDAQRFSLDANEPARSIEVDVSGCRAIGLVTSKGKHGSVGDQVNWLDARVYQ